MKELTDSDKMPFGKHKDLRMDEVPASYFFWLWTERGMEKDKVDPVADYIRRNKGCLELEYKDGVW